MSFDKLTIIKKRCAVTMFDREVEFTRDGRERGIWIFFRDAGHTETLWKAQIIERMLVRFMDELKLKGKKRLTARSHFHLLFDSFWRTGEGDGVLLEWPAWQQVYQALSSAMWQNVSKEIVDGT